LKKKPYTFIYPRRFQKNIKKISRYGGGSAAQLTPLIVAHLIFSGSVLTFIKAMYGVVLTLNR
jgi:hypothetical protein